MNDMWLKLNCDIMALSMVKCTVKILLRSACIYYLMPYDDSVPSPLLFTDITVKYFLFV